MVHDVSLLVALATPHPTPTVSGDIGVIASNVDIWAIIGKISTLVGVPGAIAAAVAWSFKRIENRQLHAQSVAIEHVKSDLRRVDDRSKTQYDWLHQKQAEAAVDIYALVIDVDLEIRRLLQAVTHGKPTDEDKVALFSAAARSGTLFRQKYTRVALLLPESVVRELEAFDDAIWEREVAARVYGRDMTGSDRLALATQDWASIPGKIASLRKSLRDALGVVEADAKK